MRLYKIILAFLIVFAFVACKKETSSDTTSNVSITITRNGIDNSKKIECTKSKRSGART